MALSALTARTHPRGSGIATQLAVLAVAVLLGLAVGAGLLLADQRSWNGARTYLGTVTGRSDIGVIVEAAGRDVTLHLAKVPRTGTKIEVEISPDGRARPTSFSQTWGKAARSGVGLAVLLVLILQVYRFAVTRPTAAVDRTGRGPPEAI